jgi:hypothetical protein
MGRDNEEKPLSQDRDTILSLLLADYVAEVEAGEQPDLRYLIAQNPDLEDELTDAVASYWLDAHSVFEEQAKLETSPEYQVQMAQILNDPAQQARIRQLLNTAASAQAEIEEAIPGLYKLIVRQGLKIPEVAQELNITQDILSSLDRRVVKIDKDLPNRLLADLAEVLHISFSQLLNYFRRPVLGSHNFMAEDKPDTTTQLTFAELVDSSVQLTQEQKTYWRKEIKTNSYKES